MSRARYLVPLFVFATALSASTANPPAQVEVTNLPAVQPVTGEELRTLQETLALLTLRASGAVPDGLATPGTDECLVTELTDFFESEVKGVPPGPVGCSLLNYAQACTEAAKRHRSRCAEVCSEFRQLDGVTPCRGSDRPVIEPFYPKKHCTSDPELGPLVRCIVTGRCTCDP